MTLPNAFSFNGRDLDDAADVEDLPITSVELPCFLGHSAAPDKAMKRCGVLSERVAFVASTQLKIQEQ
jgi:hypothetical protein